METALTVLLCACAVQWTAGQDDAAYSRYNFFDMELLRTVCSTETGNVVVSPASVKAVLAMVLEGSQGNTAEQIRAALRLPASREDVRNLLQKYLSNLQSSSNGYTLEMANRLFLSQEFSVKADYAAALRSYYYADVQRVNFGQAKATADIINDWVNTVTHELIPTLVDEENLQKDAKLMLANAIFFKGRWRTEFDLDGTLVRCFYPKSGTCQKTYMMESVDYYHYGTVEVLDAQAIDIPYQDGKFSMLVVMPNKIDGIGQLIRDLPHLSPLAIRQNLELTEVVLSLPRFELDYSIDLVNVLQQLEIKDVFGPNANLTAMVKETEYIPHISNVFHKSKIIVNEEGSVAAAGTGALVIPLMGSTVPRIRFDRPFLFFIRETTRGSLIFAGRVTAPEEVKPQDAPTNQNKVSTPGTHDTLTQGMQQMHKAERTTAAPTLNNDPASQRAPWPQEPAVAQGTVNNQRAPSYPTLSQSYPNLRDKTLPQGSTVNGNEAAQNNFQQPRPNYEDSIHFSDKRSINKEMMEMRSRMP